MDQFSGGRPNGITDQGLQNTPVIIQIEDRRFLLSSLIDPLQFQFVLKGLSQFWLSLFIFNCMAEN